MDGSEANKFVEEDTKMSKKDLLTSLNNKFYNSIVTAQKGASNSHTDITNKLIKSALPDRSVNAIA